MIVEQQSINEQQDNNEDGLDDFHEEQKAAPEIVIDRNEGNSALDVRTEKQSSAQQLLTVKKLDEDVSGGPDSTSVNSRRSARGAK